MTIVLLLGVLVIIPGILHIFGGFRISQAYGSQWAWGYLIGSVQLLLGVILLIYPWEPIPIVLLIASIWCIITGILLLIDDRFKRVQAISDEEKITNQELDSNQQGMQVTTKEDSNPEFSLVSSYQSEKIKKSTRPPLKRIKADTEHRYWLGRFVYLQDVLEVIAHQGHMGVLVINLLKISHNVFTTSEQKNDDGHTIKK